MKKLHLILLCLVVALTSAAQTIGEAFYIYRNDGQFNAFFRDEVDSIAYSHYDLDSLYYDENVTQLVYTPDSLYRIPLAAIDSVAFVTPETKINPSVFPLTAEHSPYISSADTLHFSMLLTTPAAFLPSVGNIVVATADCNAFPDGIVAKIENRETTATHYRFSCSLASIDDVFDQILLHTTQTEGSEHAGNSRALDLRRASLSDVLWERNWTKTFSGGGTTTTLNVGDRASVVVTARKTLTTPFYFQLQLVNTLSSSISFNAKSTVGYWQEIQIGNTISVGKITVPYTAGLLWFTPKLSLYGYFEEEGKVELNYSGHFDRIDKVVFTYTQGQWAFNHAPSTNVGTDIANLSMEGSAEVGLRPQIDFSLNGRRAGFGMSAKVGLKEYINFTLDMTKLTSGTLYDAMRDSYCRTTIPWSVTAHASADIFKGYDSNFTDVGFATASYTFTPAKEPQWGEDRYIFPLFSDVEAHCQNDDKTAATAKSQISRTTLMPVQVGFSLIDKDKNIVQTKYDNRTYKVGSLFNSYSVDFAGVKTSEDYTVRPSVKLMGYDVLASPSADLIMDFPVKLSDFTVTKKQHEKGAFFNDGSYYDYRFDASVTATLTNSDNVRDWGYVYRDPNGREKEISLVQPSGYGTSYTDTRWAYFRNGTPPFTCTLIPYVKYADGDAAVYGEPQDFPLEYSETTCPDDHHPHMIDLGLPSGTKWACCNVGASAPEEYGNYYAWGETQPKSYYIENNYAYYIDSVDIYDDIGRNIAGTGYDAATVNWGYPWRMPSQPQLSEFSMNCTQTWTTVNGVNGFKYVGPNGGSVFFPAAGLYGDMKYCVGSLCVYLTSELYDGSSYWIYALFGSNGIPFSITFPNRISGYSLRPVRYN